MASVLTLADGRFAIQFTNRLGKRPTIRLGKCSREIALEVRKRIEKILEYQEFQRQLDPEMLLWLNQLGPKIQSRFARAGLMTELPPSTIEELCVYCMKHFGGKPRTQVNYGHARDNLISFFGVGRSIHTITPGDVAEYRKWSLTEAKNPRYKTGKGLADTTLSKRCKVAKQFFAFAVKKRWLSENPFADLKNLVSSNDERQYFISEELIYQVLAKITDPQLKLIVALVRFGGLRFPSEVEPLQLDWIDRSTEQIKIYSPKTEHHRGKKYRAIPLFARLRPFIDEAWFRLPAGATKLVELTFCEATYTKRLHKAIKLAGHEKWPKTWHNLRSSLITEMDEQGFSLMAITKWVGNTPAIAQKHYLQVTDEQFRRAIEGNANHK